MRNLSPLIKGSITGLVMIAATYTLILMNMPGDSPVQYIVYVLYAAGITWTLLEYSRSESYKPAFGSVFGQGFRCFIMITLIVVIFTGLWAFTHPNLAEEAAKLYREDLLKDHNKTPAEIDSMVNEAKKHYVTGIVSITIFGTLITGAIFTAAGAALLLIRKK